MSANTTIINLCEDLYYKSKYVTPNKKFSISLSELLELAVSNDLTDPKIEVKFYDDYYDGLIFESIYLVGEQPE